MVWPALSASCFCSRPVSASAFLAAEAALLAFCSSEAARAAAASDCPRAALCSCERFCACRQRCHQNGLPSPRPPMRGLGQRADLGPRLLELAGALGQLVVRVDQLELDRPELLLQQLDPLGLRWPDLWWAVGGRQSWLESRWLELS